MGRMGHSIINVRLGTYSHMFPAVDEKPDCSLADRFARASQPYKDNRAFDLVQFRSPVLRARWPLRAIRTG